MLTIRISGPAGKGINSTADIVGNIFSNLGYDVTGDSEYQSLIKGGVNYFDLNIHESQQYISNKIDILMVFNAENLDKNIQFLKREGVVIINSKWIEKIESTTQELLEEKKIQVLDLAIDDAYDNTYLLGVLVKILDIPLELVNDEVEKVFGRKGSDIVNKNKDIIKNISETYHSELYSSFTIKKLGEPKSFTYGNKMLAQGAIAGGLEYFAAYPMTPASSVLTEIIADGTVTFLQPEDEIAVINSALGASFTGKRSMVATSGGGFALMSEALSFAIQAEFPIVAVLSQRAGPSTGTPTFHEAGDLHYALNPTFGEFNHVVLSPSSFEEAYYFSGLALNIADIYQNPVIYLTDKQFSECHVSIDDELKVPEIDRGKMLETPPEDYKRYELTDDNISPRVKVGTLNGDFIATSYEHDEYGATSEDPVLKEKFTKKRFHKLDNFYQDMKISGYEVVNSGAKHMLIVNSFTSYTAKKFVSENPNYGLIIIKIIKPLDINFVKELSGVSEITFIESNYSGQLEKYMTQELKLDQLNGLKISNFRKYGLYPFYIEDFDERFNK